MRLAVLFSGGKDSTFAMYKAMKENEIVCLISVISKNEDSYMFHTPNIHLCEIQAECIGLPLIKEITKGEKEEELKDLIAVIKKAKTKYKIEGIVTGAIASHYQKDRIQKICDELNLKYINPLWQMNQEDELREIIKNKFKFVIIKISAYGFDKAWLGRVITNKDVDKLIEINKKISINLAFEGGEAETLVIDGPIFRKKIKITEAEKIMENDFTGVYKIKNYRKVNK